VGGVGKGEACVPVSRNLSLLDADVFWIYDFRKTLIPGHKSYPKDTLSSSLDLRILIFKTHFTTYHPTKWRSEELRNRDDRPSLPPNTVTRNLIWVRVISPKKKKLQYKTIQCKDALEVKPRTF